MIESPTSLFLIQNKGIKCHAMWIRNQLFLRFIFWQKQHMRTERMPLCPSCTDPPQRSTLSFYPPLTPVLLFAFNPFAVQRHLWWHHDTVPLRTFSLGHCGSFWVWNPTHLKERAFLWAFVSRHSSCRLLLPPQRRFCSIIIPLISEEIGCSDLICFM